MDVVDLKKKNKAVFCLRIGALEIPFRIPNWREGNIYRSALQNPSRPRGQIEDEIFLDLCLSEIIKDQFQSLPAGVVSSVVYASLSIAGNDLNSWAEVDRLNQDLKMMRDRVRVDAYNYLITVVMKAFPAYKISDVEELPYYEFIRLVAMAEIVLNLESPIEFKEEKKKKSKTDSLFEDARRAAQADSPIMADQDGPQDPAKMAAMAKHKEMIQRVMQRRSEG